MAQVLNDITNRICRSFCDYIGTCPEGHTCVKIKKIEKIMLEILNDRKE